MKNLVKCLIVSSMVCKNKLKALSFKKIPSSNKKLNANSSFILNSSSSKIRTPIKERSSIININKDSKDIKDINEISKLTSQLKEKNDEVLKLKKSINNMKKGVLQVLNAYCNA